MTNNAHNIWAGQTPYFADGSFEDSTGHQVAMGLIDTKTTPSDVYSFGYKHSLLALKKLVGHHGVTDESVVIDNFSRRKLGTVGQLIANNTQRGA